MGRLPVQQLLFADRQTWNAATKTVDGEVPEIVYVQPPRRLRGRRSGKRKSTWYIYSIRNRAIAYRNRGPHDPYYMPMGKDQADQQRFFETFIMPPLTADEETWLRDHGYVKMGDPR